MGTSGPETYGLLHGVLWMLLAVAFGLTARRCGAAQRGVAIAAWVTCAAASLGVVGWVLMLVLTVGEGKLLLLPTFLALVAFGIAALKPFGPGWSVPSVLAGALGLVGYVHVKSSYPGIVLSGESDLGRVGALWLLPLLILGIAMCRNRIAPAAKQLS